MAKNLTLFDNHLDYLDYKNSDSYITPNVSYCKEENEVHYNPYVRDYSKEYLTFEVLESGTITYEVVGNYDSGLGREVGVSSEIFEKVAYSTDDGETWTQMLNNSSEVGNIALSVNVNAGDKVLWKGKGVATWDPFGNWDACTHFKSTCNVNVSGNILSMMLWDDFYGVSDISENLTMSTFCAMFADPYEYIGCGEDTSEQDYPNYLHIVSAKDLCLPDIIMTNDCYEAMFSGCTSLTIVPELPATTLSKGCYRNMFLDCTSLTTAPELPATTLAENCYFHMFRNCTSLTTAPTLPATTLVKDCYAEMFIGCTSLTTAPELPATTLASYCYSGMFRNCRSLTTAPKLLATTLASCCYDLMFLGCTSLITAPILPATTLAPHCYLEMFYDCTSLVVAPELPATTLAGNCYDGMFWGCTSLTTAPELPATTLAGGCYSRMFYECISLTSAPELPATTLTESCYMTMFTGCTSLITAPALPATILMRSCYHGMFTRCTSLTTAPTLPAITLVSNCYTSMFYGCTSLNYIKAMFKTTPSTSYTSNWVYNVSSTGTFVKNSAAGWTTRGVNGIPTGWTIQTASA